MYDQHYYIDPAQKQGSGNSVRRRIFQLVPVSPVGYPFQALRSMFIPI